MASDEEPLPLSPPDEAYDGPPEDEPATPGETADCIARLGWRRHVGPGVRAGEPLVVPGRSTLTDLLLLSVILSAVGGLLFSWILFVDGGVEAAPMVRFFAALFALSLPLQRILAVQSRLDFSSRRILRRFSFLGRSREETVADFREIRTVTLDNVGPRGASGTPESRAVALLLRDGRILRLTSCRLVRAPVLEACAALLAERLAVPFRRNRHPLNMRIRRAPDGGYDLAPESEPLHPDLGRVAQAIVFAILLLVACLSLLSFLV